MKEKMGILNKKEATRLVARSLKIDGIELITIEQALGLRGGDKDYSPVYEHQVEKHSRLTDPSILLKLQE